MLTREYFIFSVIEIKRVWKILAYIIIRVRLTRRVFTTCTTYEHSSRYKRFTISWAHKLNDGTHCSFSLLPHALESYFKPMSYVCHIMSCACVNVRCFFSFRRFWYYFLTRCRRPARSSRASISARNEWENLFCLRALRYVSLLESRAADVDSTHWQKL